MNYNDDLVRRQPEPTVNIDYLTCEYQEYLSDNLNLANTFEDVQDPILRWRLRNACWRRQAINLGGLPRCSPHVINWQKCGDITWLYGPQYKDHVQAEELQEVPKQAPTAVEFTESEADISDSESSLIMSSCDDICSMLLFDSGYMPDDEKMKITPARKRTGLMFYGVDALGALHSRKSCLKTQRGNYRNKKRVTFNCIIRSREDINGRVCDYDYLDEYWL